MVPLLLRWLLAAGLLPQLPFLLLLLARGAAAGRPAVVGCRGGAGGAVGGLRRRRLQLRLPAAWRIQGSQRQQAQARWRAVAGGA